MDYHIQPFQPSDLAALTAFIAAYRQTFPDAKLLPVEYYANHPALKGGKRLWCAYDTAQRMVGMAPLFAAPAAPGSATGDPNRIWTVVLADPTLPAGADVLIRDALLDQVIAQAQQIAATFPPGPTHLCADLMASQQPDIQHLLVHGFRVLDAIAVLERATALPFTMPSAPQAVTIHTSRLATPDEQQLYLEAYNRSFLDRHKTLAELHFFLSSPLWQTGMAFAAFDQAQQLVGSILVYWDAQHDCGVIDDVFVLPSWRRQGLARYLMGVSLTYCREHGIANVRLEVRRGNTPAVRLYTSMGYTQTNEELLLERNLIS